MAKICKWLLVFKSKAELRCDCCVGKSSRRKKSACLLKKCIFFLLGEDKISHFQSTQLHCGILKKTVLPYEERQEHSWKKNDCCTAWMNVISPHCCCSSSLHRREPETFVVSGCPYVHLPCACGCFISTDVSDVLTRIWKMQKKWQVPGRSNYN